MSTPDTNGWMPIETAPKDGATFLAWDGFCCLGAWYPYGEEFLFWAIDGDEISAEDITHWQPAPKPPLPTQPEGQTP